MPLFLLSAFSWVRSAFGAVVSFCSKPPGLYIAAAAALALGVWWYGHHEFNAGVAQCNAAHAKAAAVEVKREQTVIVSADAHSDARTAKSTAINNANNAKVKIIHDEAAALPPAPECAIPSDIADRLRGLQ